MTSTKLRSALLTALLVVSTFASAGAMPVSGASGNESGNAAATTFSVSQGGRCYEVTPLGSGDTNVSTFYDYRNPEEPEQGNNTFSSWGTTDIQENQVSKLFVYNGSKGYSLVVLHDKMARDGGDGSYASTVTFNFSGMPSDGMWAVQDDTYTIGPNNTTQDDNWYIQGSNHTIDWMWVSNRTDGGAFRGIAGEEITIEPGFNESAREWNNWSQTGPNDTIASWELRTRNGSERTLDMSRNVTISTGGCGDTEPPQAALSAPDSAANDEEVTFDASASTDNGNITEYRWDFDGDGETDATTTNDTVNHTYTSTGTYTATVTVVDEANNSDTASATVEVKRRGQPNAELSASPTTAGNDEPITFDGSDSTDDRNITEYRWDFDGDGETDATTTNDTVNHTYADYGTYDATLTVVDDQNNTDSDTVTVRIRPPDDEAPNASLSASPSNATTGETVTLDASDSTDDRNITEYRWDFDNDSEVDETTETPTIEHRFSETGDQTVAVTVVDGNNNTDTATTTVSVSKGDEPPNADIAVEGEAVLSEVTHFVATGSTDDDGIVKYMWDLDSDGDIEWTTKDGDAYLKTWSFYERPGTYEASVIVVDTAGQRDTATVTVNVTREVTANPSADLVGPDTVEVGEQFTLAATNVTTHAGLTYTGWKIDGHEVARGLTWNASFDEPGTVTVTFYLRDRANNMESYTKNVTVVTESTPGTPGDGGSDDDSSDDNPSDDNPSDDNPSDDNPSDDNPSDDDSSNTSPPEDPIGDDDDTETRSGDIGTTNPDDTDDSSPGPVTKPITDTDGRVGTVTVAPGASDGTVGVDVTATPPAGVATPTAESAGFTPLSYVTVSSATDANVTVAVSKDRLDGANATPDAVSLFSYRNGSWTAVTTERIGETGSTYRFTANASDGTYAVGIGRAATGVADLTVRPTVLSVGDETTVVATVGNDGYVDGTYVVELTVDGEVVATERVSVPANETREVTFTHEFASAGTHELSVDDESIVVIVEDRTTTEGGSTTDGETTTDRMDDGQARTGTSATTTENESTGVPGFGVAPALVALLAGALLALRRL